MGLKTIKIDITNLRELYIQVTALEHELGLFPKVFSNCDWCRLGLGYIGKDKIGFVPVSREKAPFDSPRNPSLEVTELRPFLSPDGDFRVVFRTETTKAEEPFEGPMTP